MTSALAYGGDYNPEQWSAAIVDQDIELMLEAGVNLVLVGIFSWAVLQSGIGVDLATATASPPPPPWLGHLYPDTLPVTRDGVRLGYGFRHQYNPSSARYREESVKMARPRGTLRHTPGTEDVACQQ